MTVMAFNVREKKLHRQPALRRDDMESARKTMQAIQLIGQPVQNMLYVFQPKTSSSLSFSSMELELFIYLRNRTNSR